MQQSKVYFKGLNGLRFFAAFLVLMQHAESNRSGFSLFNLANYTLFSSGASAVEFFFVLSGFLITYLLLEEEANSGTINVRNFYMRRVLRIWPLYYLVLIIGLLLIPAAIKIVNHGYTPTFPLTTAGLLFTLFLPNLVTSIWEVGYLTPLWSIGVEEQFYFFWAPLVKYFKKYAIAIFATIIVLRGIFYAYSAVNPPTVLTKFLFTLKFEAMSVGGLGAWLFYHFRERMMNMKIFNRGCQILFLSLIAVRLTCHNYLTQENTTWIGVAYSAIFGHFYSFLATNALFLWLILNTSSNPKTILTTNNKILNFLGNLSFGIYMYHSIVLLFVVLILKNILRTLSPLSATIALYAISSVLTFITAYLSYRLVESRFLSLKKAFEPKSSTVAAERNKDLEKAVGA
ncbi:acyltransferase [Chitinophaga filiformis]|uniref:acyltransferase family protein n=1 Tax=Chitinophaga filiformis TaxID=104663 RepID=UPI001F3F4126|nr:acyltransferase [Chitinophaga filiformis]MCF6405175.1 acyltransferase [Chitinophaga filiformis]